MINRFYGPISIAQDVEKLYLQGNEVGLKAVSVGSKGLYIWDPVKKLPVKISNQEAADILQTSLEQIANLVAFAGNYKIVDPVPVTPIDPVEARSEAFSEEVEEEKMPEEEAKEAEASVDPIEQDEAPDKTEVIMARLDKVIDLLTNVIDLITPTQATDQIIDAVSKATEEMKTAVEEAAAEIIKHVRL